MTATIDDQPERQMDARGARAGIAEEGQVDAERRRVGRGQECRDVGADGVEGHVPEVQQARETGDDVQADGHDREDRHERHDGVVRQRQRDVVPAELGEELLVDDRVDQAPRTMMTVRMTVRAGACGAPCVAAAGIADQRCRRRGRTSRPARCRSPRSTRSCPIRQLLAEEAGRLEDEDDDEDPEDDRLGPVRGHVAVAERGDLARGSARPGRLPACSRCRRGPPP